MVFNKLPVTLQPSDLVTKANSFDAIFGNTGIRKTIQSDKKTVDDSNKAANTNLGLLESDVAAVTKTDSWKQSCSQFTDLAKATASRFVHESSEALVPREHLSESLGSLAAVLDKYKDKASWDGTSYIFANVVPSFEKIQKVAVTVNQLKIDDTKQPIVRFGSESFAYPMFQIGVGTGADRPSIVAGIGLRFTHPQHLALSFGYAVTWFKDLDKLKVGDEVKGTADLNADLQLRRSSAKPYICIQYSF